jgi:hypothetical protein
MKTVYCAAILLGFSTLAMAEPDSRTWKGTWVNKRYNSNGTLECVAKPGKDGTWTATFSGVFMGKPFTYDVTFDGKAAGGQTILSGKAEINNQKYDWTGSIKGDTLKGQYRSNGGYFGDFTLKEAR